jgi:hypothetical protein
MSTNEVRTTVRIDGAQKGAADVSNVQQALETLAGGARGVGSMLASAHPAAAAAAVAIGAVGAAAMGAARMLESMVRTGREWAQLGGEFSAVATAFERLANPQVLARLEQATGRLVGNMRLMREFNQADRAGLLNEKQIEASFALVTRASQDLGENVEQMLQRLGSALSSGELGMFADLGVNIGEVQRQVRAAGESMETTRGRTHGLLAAFAQLAAQTRDTDHAAGHLGDAAQQIGVAWENVRMAFYRTFAENPEFTQDLVRVADAIAAMVPHAIDLAEIIGAGLHAQFETLRDVLDRTRFGVDWLVRGFEHLLTYYNMDVFGVQSHFLGWWQRFADILDRASRALGGITSHGAPPSPRDVFGGFAAPPNYMEEGEQPSPLSGSVFEASRGYWGDQGPSAFGGGGGGRRGGGSRSRVDELAQAIEQERRFRAEHKGYLQEELDLMDAEGRAAQVIAEWERERKETAEEQLRLANERIEANRQEYAEALEADRQRLERMDLIAARTDAAETSYAKIAERARTSVDWIGLAGTALRTVGDALESHLSFREREIALQLQLGKITQAEAEKQWQGLEKTRKIVGGIKAAESFVEASQEIARAIGAIPNPILIASHALSAASHITAGVMALTQLGGTATPPPGGTAAVNAATRADYDTGRKDRSSAAEPSTTSIMLVSLSSASMAREMAKAERTRRRLGMPAGMAGEAARR